jgi:hypothetical protein
MYDDSSVHIVPPERVITDDSYIACMIPRRHADTMRSSMNDLISKARDYAMKQEKEMAEAAAASESVSTVTATA